MSARRLASIWPAPAAIAVSGGAHVATVPESRILPMRRQLTLAEIVEARSSKSDLCFVDFFCGCGGASQGAAAMGAEPILGFDMNPVKLMQYEANFPGAAAVEARLGAHPDDYDVLGDPEGESKTACSLDEPSDSEREKEKEKDRVDHSVWAPTNAELIERIRQRAKGRDVHIHGSPPCVNFCSIGMASCKDTGRSSTGVDWFLSFVRQARDAGVCASWSMEEAAVTNLGLLEERLVRKGYGFGCIGKKAGKGSYKKTHYARLMILNGVFPIQWLRDDYRGAGGFSPAAEEAAPLRRRLKRRMGCMANVGLAHLGLPVRRDRVIAGDDRQWDLHLLAAMAPLSRTSAEGISADYTAKLKAAWLRASDDEPVRIIPNRHEDGLRQTLRNSGLLSPLLEANVSGILSGYVHLMSWFRDDTKGRNEWGRIGHNSFAGCRDGHAYSRGKKLPGSGPVRDAAERVRERLLREGASKGEAARSLTNLWAKGLYADVLGDPDLFAEAERSGVVVRRDVTDTWSRLTPLDPSVSGNDYPGLVPGFLASGAHHWVEWYPEGRTANVRLAKDVDPDRHVRVSGFNVRYAGPITPKQAFVLMSFPPHFKTGRDVLPRDLGKRHELLKTLKTKYEITGDKVFKYAAGAVRTAQIDGVSLEGYRGEPYDLNHDEVDVDSMCVGDSVPPLLMSHIIFTLHGFRKDRSAYSRKIVAAVADSGEGNLSDVLCNVPAFTYPRFRASLIELFREWLRTTELSKGSRDIYSGTINKMMTVSSLGIAYLLHKNTFADSRTAQRKRNSRKGVSSGGVPHGPAFRQFDKFLMAERNGSLRGHPALARAFVSLLTDRQRKIMQNKDGSKPMETQQKKVKEEVFGTTERGDLLNTVFFDAVLPFLDADSWSCVGHVGR